MQEGGRQRGSIFLSFFRSLSLSFSFPLVATNTLSTKGVDPRWLAHPSVKCCVAQIVPFAEVKDIQI